MGESSKMSRDFLLAAELYNYSYANYADHLGIGNARFEQIMPRDVRTIQKALMENWSHDKIAAAFDIETEDVDDYLQRYRDAMEVVDAKDPSESFRAGVRQSIKLILKDTVDEDRIEELVTQICYRAADLGFLLHQRRHQLNSYSRHLRRDPECDYHEGYFDIPEEKKQKER